MKRFIYDNKTIIITGASSGIGKEICRILIEKHSAKIIAISKTEEKLKKVLKEFNNSSNYIPLPLDVSIESEWDRLLTFIKENNYVIDGIINCAGVLPKFSNFKGMNKSEVDKVIATNFQSVVYSARTILPILRQNNGIMATVSSSSALCPFKGVSTYSATKSATENFIECLTLEENSVLVSSIMPGYTKSDIMRSNDLSDKEKRFIGKISSSPVKVAKKIVKKTSKGKRRIIIGLDAHMMNLLYKFFPKKAPRLISWFLKKSKLKLFENVFDK